MQQLTALRALDLYIAGLFAAAVLIGGLGLFGLAPELLGPLSGTLFLVALLSVTARLAALIVRGD